MFPIGAAADEQQFPAVTTNEQDRYLVVWQDKRWGDWDIYGQFLDVNGNPVGAETWIAASSDDDTQADAVFNGAAQQILVIWQRGTASGESIVAQLMNANGSWLDYVEIAPGRFGDNGHPAVGTHLSGYLVTYEWGSWDPNAKDDVYGRLWSQHAVFLPLILRKAT